MAEVPCVLEVSDLFILDGSERWPFPGRRGERPPPLHPTDCIHGRLAVRIGGTGPIPLDSEAESCLRVWVRLLREEQGRLEDDPRDEDGSPRDRREYTPFVLRGGRTWVECGTRRTYVACDASALRDAITAFLGSLETRITESHPDGAAWWRDVCARVHSDHE